MNKLLIALLILAVGIAIGYWLHPEPTMWDIFDDPRGCVIEWDDGEVMVKSRERSLGTIKPGESKTITIDVNNVFPFNEEAWKNFMDRNIDLGYPKVL